MKPSLKKKPTVSVFRGKIKTAPELLLKVMSALKNAGYSPEEVRQYASEASNQGLGNILQVSAKWIDLK